MALTAALDKSLPAYSSALNSRLYTAEKAARSGVGDSGGQIYQHNLLTRINTSSPTSKFTLILATTSSAETVLQKRNWEKNPLRRRERRR